MSESVRADKWAFSAGFASVISGNDVITLLKSQHRVYGFYSHTIRNIKKYYEQFFGGNDYA